MAVLKGRPLQTIDRAPPTVTCPMQSHPMASALVGTTPPDSEIECHSWQGQWGLRWLPAEPQLDSGICRSGLQASVSGFYLQWCHVTSPHLFFSSEHVCSFSQSLWWRELVVICLNQASGFQDTCCCLIYQSLSMSGNKLCKPCPLVYLPQKRVLGINIVLCHGH